MTLPKHAARYAFDDQPVDVPLALAELHQTLAVGAELHIAVPARDWSPDRLVDVIVGGGFAPQARDGSGAPIVADRNGWLELIARRDRTLPDRVAPGMRLLLCGLNPSFYAADAGVGFARPGNRFWPAALQAGIVSVDRDPLDALRTHGVGMTDLVKRASVGAAELSRAEYQAGLARLERLVRWLQPKVVCFVGLAGWRAAADRKAKAGVVGDGFAGAAAYVMPNPSGLNAHSSVGDLAAHLSAAWALGASPRGAPSRQESKRP